MRSLFGGESVRAIAILVLVAAVAFPWPAAAQEEQAEGAPVVVTMANAKDFVEQSVVATVNQTVRFSNTDSVPHDVTAMDLSWNSTGGPGGMASGSVYDHIFTEAGVYDYYCTLHDPTGEYKNMWGRVIVVAAEPAVVPGGAHGPSPEEFGVRWLAHWVGIISFVAVIAVLVIYYFVLKYGETVHATDHRDRKEK